MGGYRPSISVSSMFFAIVFDMDGVLVEFKIDYMRLRSDIIDYLVSVGVPRDILSIEDLVFTTIIKGISFLKRKLGFSREEILRVLEECNRIVEGYETRAAMELSIRDDAIEVLSFLRDKGVRLALFTMNTIKVVRIFDSKKKFTHFFDIVVARKGTQVLKPNKTLLASIVRRLGAPVSKTAIVSDSPIDIVPARELGLTTIMISRDSERIRKASPHILFPDFESFKEYIFSLYSRSA